jgi:hypothetical protein
LPENAYLSARRSMRGNFIWKRNDRQALERCRSAWIQYQASPIGEIMT